MKYKIFLFLFYFLLSINFSFSANSTIINGINLTIEINNSDTYFSSPVSFSSVSNIIPTSTNLSLNKVTQSINHSSNLYNTIVSIYSIKGDPSSLLCSSSSELSLLQDCLITYDFSMIRNPQTYYAYICNGRDDCTLSYPFTFMLNDDIEYITSGISFTLEKNNPDTYFSSPVSFSSVSNIIPTSTNLSLNEVTQSINHSSNSYNTIVSIYSIKGDPSSLLCSSSSELSLLQDCLITYDFSMIRDLQTYYAYICNERDDCTLSYPFTFMLNDDIEYITSGIKFELQKDFNGTVFPSLPTEGGSSSSSGPNISILPFGGTPFMAFTSLLLIGLSLFFS